MIDRERWQQLSALLDEALALPAADRPAWLAALRQRDAGLAEDLQPLLAQAAASADDDDDGDGGGATAGRATGAALPPAAASAGAPGEPVPGFAHWLGQALATGPDGATAAPLAGRQLGAWRLLRKIGEGGMGQVWLAQRADGLYQGQAAIKLLRSDLDAAGLAGRFARERAVLARLNHPAVARLLDAGIADGQAYLVLEHVDGRPLPAHVRAACPLVAQRVRLLMRIAEAVDHAHAQLIVHRDLKPSNVLVTHAGEPKLLDFGIAGLLDDGEPADTDLTRQTGRGLTLGYAAPEQILGGPIGTAADVFALGVMLFELLSGELPFAPRGAARLAAEHAVLHAEPRRLASLVGAGDAAAAAAEDSPGRPADIARVRGDLEAIVAKALRKQPAERYRSVQALIDDLARWLAHQPVSARRDDWRHRTRLWLRRNTALAGGLLLLVGSLAAGLAASTWQWRRAEAAARQSDQVTQYLTELLASASPDRHGGQWPTVLQLLDTSRQRLAGRFAQDPDTRLRLLQVLAETYHELNRFDLAMPLYDELVGLARQRHGDDHARTLALRLDQARTLQVQGLFDQAIARLEPLQAPVRQAFGGESDEYRRLLYILSTSYARTGRLDDADRMLGDAGRLTAARFAPGSPEHLSHLNHIQVLRAGQGRLREALAAMRQTEPYWGDAQPENARQQLVLRRNLIAIQIRLSDYDRIPERIQALLADMDRLLGPGNDMAAGLRVELARYHTEAGDAASALAQRQDILDRAQAAQVRHPAVLLGLRVAVLLARAQAHVDDGATLGRQARALLADIDREQAQMGYGRADAWINLARVGLLLDDASLAADAVGRLRADSGLQLDKDLLLASRVAQIDGELARLQGDLPRSQDLLRQRVQVFDRPGADRQVLPAWVALLDLAYTQVLMGSPEAATTLAQAAARRPPGVPAGHALDAAQAYLQARLAAGAADGAAPGAEDGAADSPDLARALAQLQRRQGRRPGQPAGAGLGSLGGAFI